LAKRYVDEADSSVVRALLRDHPVATCRLSEVEVASALARRHREGTLSRVDLDRALSALRADVDAIALVELSVEVGRVALALLFRYPLRAGDSIQLASCLHLGRQTTEEIRILAYDRRLNDAARSEGLRLAPPRS
jgi:predicted nucleic acid-binding protein